MQNEPDQVLLERARAGDARAMETLLERHQAQVYRFGMKMCRDPEDAKDVLQDTLLSVARSLRDFRGNSSISTWLFTIATNLSRNHFRSQKRRRLAYEAVTAVAVEADGVGPDAGLIGGEVGAAIEAVVTRLPFKQRVAFLQRKIHGLDYASIGQALQCSAESARAHVFQALRKIRQALRDDPEQPRFIQTVTGRGYRFVAPVLGPAPAEAPPARPVEAAPAAPPQRASPRRSSSRPRGCA